MQVFAFAGAFGALLTAFVTNHMIIDFFHRVDEIELIGCKVSRLDSFTSVHIQPDILHRFLDEMSRGWCRASQPLRSDGQGAACTSCTCNF